MHGSFFALQNVILGLYNTLMYSGGNAWGISAPQIFENLQVRHGVSLIASASV